jgi:hypothetical protein
VTGGDQILNARLAEGGHAARQGAADLIVGIDTDNSVAVANEGRHGHDADVSKTDNDDFHRHRKDMRLASTVLSEKVSGANV